MSFGRLGSLGRGFGRLGAGRGGAGSVILPGVLSASAGSYNWSGDPMTPVVDHVLAAGGGSYTYSGQDVSFLRSWLIPASGGSYTYTGQDATLTKAAAAGATFNPSDKGANVTLSNGDLTATNSTGSRGNVRSTTSHTSGKYYVRASGITCPNGYDLAIGIASASASLTSSSGTPDTNSAAMFNGDATVYVAGGFGGTSSNYVTGDIVDLALDLDASPRRIWMRVNGGNWNNSGTANPATNTEGFDVSAVTGAIFIIVDVLKTGVNTVVTMDFSATTGRPSGFGAW